MPVQNWASATGRLIVLSLTQADMQLVQCMIGTALGAPVNKHVARNVLGKAITSRIAVAPASNMVSRS